jgi:hypothetical protein
VRSAPPAPHEGGPRPLCGLGRPQGGAGEVGREGGTKGEGERGKKGEQGRDEEKCYRRRWIAKAACVTSTSSLGPRSYLISPSSLRPSLLLSLTQAVAGMEPRLQRVGHYRDAV